MIFVKHCENFSPNCADCHYLPRLFFIHPSLCLCINVSVCLYVCLAVCLSINVSVCLSVCLTVHLSIYQFLCLSMCLFECVCLSVYQCVCLSVQHCVCLSLSQSGYLSAYPFISPSVLSYSMSNGPLICRAHLGYEEVIVEAYPYGSSVSVKVRTQSVNQ